ncbi:MAG TPA: SDR family oxidoreductase [Trueperaceae bacterium]
MEDDRVAEGKRAEGNMNNKTAQSRPKVVVVTGASAGVGRATVRAFASEGAKVGMLARNRDRLEAAAREVQERGGQALPLPTDVADPEAVEAAAAAVEDAFGPIDIWVNNAMTSVFAPLAQIQPDEFRRVTEVTYLGCVYGTMAALSRMLPRDQGTIIQVGSALAYRSIPLQSAYCGAKHAIVGFTDSLRCELIHDGSHIQLSVVHLPALNTPQFDWVLSRLPRKPQPVPPIFQPEVAARAIVHAAHHPKREYLVGAETAAIVWGNKFLPGVGDWYLGKTGYASQQYDGQADPDRPANLWETVDGDYAAHGDFDNRAKDWSVTGWLTHNSGVLALAAGVLAGAAALQLGAGRE